MLIITLCNWRSVKTVIKNGNKTRTEEEKEHAKVNKLEH